MTYRAVISFLVRDTNQEHEPESTAYMNCLFDSEEDCWKHADNFFEDDGMYRQMMRFLEENWPGFYHDDQPETCCAGTDIEWYEGPVYTIPKANW